MARPVVRGALALVVLLQLLAVGAALAQPPAPAPQADLQARCAAEGGCVLVTQRWLQQEAERLLRAAREAAAKSCRRTDA